MSRRSVRRRWWGGAVALLWGLAAAGAAVGHPLAPALLELREAAPGRATVLWRRPLLLPSGASLEPVLPAHCRTAEPPVEGVEGPAVVRRWTIDCGARGLSGETLAVSDLGLVGSEVLVRVLFSDDHSFQAVLRPGEPSCELPRAPQGAWAVGADYLRLGFEHLVTGWDHLAFVFGLVLWVGGRRQLLTTVTAFTVGHSVTLSIAALGLVRLPPAPIEVLIAASILVLAVELARMRPPRPFARGRRPEWMAASFGLLHGLGFAGALAEVGLPAGEIPLALFSFNVGIELGQLAFVLGLLTLGFALQPLRPRLPAWSAAVPAYGIGTLAAFWTFVRLAQL